MCCRGGASLLCVIGEEHPCYGEEHPCYAL